MWAAELVEGEWCLVDRINKETFSCDCKSTAVKEAKRLNAIWKKP